MHTVESVKENLYGQPVQFGDGTQAQADLSGTLSEYAEVRIHIHDSYVNTWITWARIAEMLNQNGVILV